MDIMGKSDLDRRNSSCQHLAVGAHLLTLVKVELRTIGQEARGKVV